jgi:predicted small metal-binding protein
MLNVLKIAVRRWRTTSDQDERRRTMYEHSCAKAGAVGCGWVVRANSEEDLKRKVIEHARKKHNVQGMTDTIYTYLREQAKRA